MPTLHANVLSSDIGEQALNERAMQVRGAENPAAFFADAAFQQVKEDPADVAIGLDVRFPEEPGSHAHAGNDKLIAGLAPFET
jgi:hypothetical protein